MSKLKPPKNLREVTPRVCAFCKFLKSGNGGVYCLRPNGPGWDSGDGFHYIYVCDLFQQGEGVVLLET